MRFKEGDFVQFSTGDISGTGLIRGVATTPSPLIGCSWIVQVLVWDGETSYEYSHAAFFDNQLQLLKKNDT